MATKTKTAAKAAGGKSKAATKGKASKPELSKPEQSKSEQPKSDEKVRELERQLQESKDALKQRSDQLADTARLLDVSRRELQAMREKARAIETQASPTERSKEGTTGKIRCPRCSGPMTEYDHAVVRADRCDNCQGIFFDNGELEQVVEKALKDHDGQTQGSWFSSLFGRREKTKTT
jgi:Zn-finger nucleic acid-binding protein